MKGSTNNRYLSIIIACLLVICGLGWLMNFGSRNAQSETYVSGIITGFVETWDLAGSPYIVIGDVTVSSASTLIIEPGVIVKFNGYYSIYVDGNLMAVGTETNRINITSNMTMPNLGNWDRIQINPTGYAEIKYCDINYGTYGIYLASSSTNNITNNNISSNNEISIFLFNSSNNTITNNNLTNNMIGIYLFNSSNNNTIINNNISNNTHGIDIRSSLNNNILGNCIYSNNEDGIRLRFSSNNNIITSNYISLNNGFGINHQSSSNNIITGNNFVNNGIFLQGSQLSQFNSHEIPTNNTVNGKPLYYHKNRSGINIDGIPIGQLILTNCTEVDISNLQINNTDVGIEIAFSTNITLTGSNISSNKWYGIYLWSSSNNNITGNNISINDYGIVLCFSIDNSIIDNYVLNNKYGIDLEHSSGNSVVGNNVSDNRYGVDLEDSDGNSIIGNNVSNNTIGIYLHDTKVNNIVDNTMIENGIFIVGGFLEHWNTHYIDTTNTVNGKPVYYWKNQTSGVVPSGAGQVILANCTNVKIENQEIDGGSVGILLGYSSNNYITGNIVSSNNWDGIYFYDSDKNNITDNMALSNEWSGIRLAYSNENNITDNIISNNSGGIHLQYAGENKIVGNTFSDNGCGLNLEGSIENNIIGNTALNNGYGIILWLSSDNNIITGNNLFNNDQYGIILWSSSSNNHIYHNNIINNTNQASDDTNNGNQWHNGYPSGGNFWSDYNGIDLNSTSTQNIPPPDGIGDTPYEIDSDSWDNYPLMAPLGNCIILYEGWNLISIPFIQPDTNLGTVLNSIKGSYDAVQWYNVSDNSDPWKHSSIKKPSHLNDLDDIHHRMGFWIHITQPGGVLFQFSGIQPIENQTITLHPGWNLVGYPSLTSYNRTQGLNNITFGTDVDSIWTYKAATKKWEEIRESDYFEIGKGYWVHSKVEKDWEIPLK